MKTPETVFTEVACEVVKSSVLQKQFIPKMDSETYDDLMIEAGCFVSIHKKNGELRGCIGTIYPTEDNLLLEIVRNSKAAASKDSRFKPITKDELEDLEISVDVLGVPYIINSISEIDPVHRGIIVSNGIKKAVLLPNLKGIETREQQLEIVKRKAGLEECTDEELQISIFTSTRYH